MDLNHLYNETIDIYRLTESKDSVFSPVSTFSLHLDNIDCRIQEEDSPEPVEAGSKRSLISYNIYLDNIDIYFDDIVIIDDETYEVIEMDFEGNFDTYIKVLVEKRDVELSS